VHLERLERISVGVMSLITAHPLPPITPEPEQRVLLTILAVMPVQGIGLVWSIVLLRRWRTHPERRPRPAIGVIRVLVPLLTNLTLLWAILNKAAGLTPDSVLLIRRFGGDIGWALLISGAVALSWGVILRPTLTALALHPRPRSEASKTQPLAQKRSTLCGNTDE
jgi:hypothetical protein